MGQSSIFNPYVEHEVWGNLYRFQNEVYVRDFAKQRIPRIKNLFTNMINKKTNYNTSKPNPEQVEILQPLTQLNDDIVAQIINNAKQAADIFHVAKELPLISKPIMSFYAFEKLANIAVLLSYQATNPPRFSHGLTFKQGYTIEVKKQGLFQRFHECYSEDLSIYLDNCAFDLGNILRASNSYDDIRLLNQHPSQSLVSVKNLGTGKEMQITELDREFIICYALATLARYRVNDWNTIIEGRTNDLNILIYRWLKSFEIIFPNSVVYILWSDKFNSTYPKFT